MFKQRDTESLWATPLLSRTAAEVHMQKREKESGSELENVHQSIREYENFYNVKMGVYL